MFDPPQVVDVTRESFKTAGFARGTRYAPDDAVQRAFSAEPEIPVQRPRAPIPFKPAAAIASIGTLTPEQIANAHLLLESTPERLRTAAHTPAEAAVLVFGLLLDDNPAIRSRQRTLVANKCGDDALRALAQLEPDFARLRPEHRLPLLQLALPTLRRLAADELDPFLDALDELVHADERVTTFEFALQKLLVHSLQLGRTPGAAAIQYHSFNAVAGEIAIVLSALAHAAVSDPGFAGSAFEAGTAQLKLLQGQLHFVSANECDFAKLDTALDKLAIASSAIKQRTLVAAAHVVSADGQVLVTEAELLRATAAALDCPMPPLAVNA
jgi:hypothetical protein